MEMRFQYTPNHNTWPKIVSKHPRLHWQTAYLLAEPNIDVSLMICLPFVMSTLVYVIHLRAYYLHYQLANEIFAIFGGDKQRYPKREKSKQLVTAESRLPSIFR